MRGKGADIFTNVSVVGPKVWGDPDVDGRIILRWIFGVEGGGCGDCMERAQDRDSWRALVSTIMNFRVP
jgi:hypothetical protein